jgi:hypothetical protein
MMQVLFQAHRALAWDLWHDMPLTPAPSINHEVDGKIGKARSFPAIDSEEIKEIVIITTGSGKHRYVPGMVYWDTHDCLVVGLRSKRVPELPMDIETKFCARLKQAQKGGS